MRAWRAGRGAVLPSLILAASLALAACAPSAPQSATKGNDAAPAGSAPAASSGGKSRITLAVGSETVSASPYGDSSPWVYAEWMHILEPLVFYNDQEGKIEPLLAESWRNLDGNTWEFKLRQGVKFSDGGDFTADDVIHSFTRIRDGQDSAQRSTLSHVVAMEAPDPYTVRLTTKQPDASLPFVLTNRSIESKAAFERAGSQEEADKHPIGTGPYMFKEWVQGQRWVIEKNPNYWGTAHKGTFDEVVFRKIQEPQAEVTALLNGEVDVAVDIPPQFVDRIQSSGSAHIETAKGSRVMFVAMQPGTKPWDNEKLRQAVSYAIDRDALVQGVLQGRGFVLKEPVGEGMLGYDPNLQPAQVYDPQKAKQLLAEAGYPNGLDVELFSSNGRYLKDKELAEAIANMLTQVGIRTKVTTPEWGKIWPDIQAGKVPFYFFGRGSVRDPSEYLHQYFRSGVTKRIGVADPEIDQALLAEQSEMDPAKRLTALRHAMSLINQKAPAAFVLTYEDTFGVSNRYNLKARGDEYLFAWDVSPR